MQAALAGTPQEQGAEPSRHEAQRLTPETPALAAHSEIDAALAPAPLTPRTGPKTEPAPPRPAAALAPARMVQTQFGGIFYLLNAALALGLYGDFTMPRTPGITLSPWDWLALVGKAWFGTAFTRDPVWEQLSAWAGRRASQRPGRDFTAPDEWKIDPAWLTPWGPIESLQVHATQSRLQVRHTAGFLVFDVARAPRLAPLTQASALCANSKPLRSAVLSRARAVSPALPRRGTARWLRCLLGYLEARLVLALGLDAHHDMPALLCRHPARVLTSLDALEVELSLADLPLAIRIAGLDRDPGWIPAAGRSLRFRFT